MKEKENRAKAALQRLLIKNFESAGIESAGEEQGARLMKDELYPLRYLRTCLLLASKEELENAEKALTAGRPWAGAKETLPPEQREEALQMSVYRWPKVVDRAFKVLLRETEEDCGASE